MHDGSEGARRTWLLVGALLGLLLPLPPTAADGSGDFDGDGVPDADEVTICEDADARDLLVALTFAGECESPSDYAPSGTGFALLVLRSLVSGPDADGDRLPAHATAVFVRLHFDPHEARPLHAEALAPIFFPLDPRDDDPRRPMSTVCEPPGIASAAIDADSDGDGIPALIVVVHSAVCATATDPPTISYHPVASFRELVLDPADSDPNDPAEPRRHFDSPAVPMGLTFGPDADDDKIPSVAMLGLATYRVDRERPRSPPMELLRVQAVPWDEFDDRSQLPMPTAVPLDADADWISDMTEAALCHFEDPGVAFDGGCVGINYRAPAAYYRVVQWAS